MTFAIGLFDVICVVLGLFVALVFAVFSLTWLVFVLLVFC